MSDYVYNETVIEHEASQDYFCVSTGEMKWKNRLHKLAQERPDECVLQADNVDGSVCYHVPKSWVKIAPPRQVSMTDERRAELAERLKRARDAQKDAEGAEQILHAQKEHSSFENYAAAQKGESNHG